MSYYIAVSKALKVIGTVPSEKLIIDLILIFPTFTLMNEIFNALSFFGRLLNNIH